MPSTLTLNSSCEVLPPVQLATVVVMVQALQPLSACGHPPHPTAHASAEDIVPRLLAPPEGVPAVTALDLQRAAASAAAADSPTTESSSAPGTLRSLFRAGSKRKRAAWDESGRPQQAATPTGPGFQGGWRRPRRPERPKWGTVPVNNAVAAPSPSQLRKQGSRQDLAASMPATAASRGSLLADQHATPVGGLHQQQQPPSQGRRITFRGRTRSWQLRMPSMQSLQERVPSVPAMQAAAGCLPLSVQVVFALV